MLISTSASVASAPFRLSVPPNDVFLHPAWMRAREECLASLAEGGRVLLCGVPGTGKTLLLQDIRLTLRAMGREVALSQHGDPMIPADETDVLLVDEADRLSGEQIRSLCLLPNPLVLAGLPGLHERLAGSVGRIGFVVLEALSVRDVARLVAARLAGSGRARTGFAPGAILALARHSGGLFRVVTILAGAALFFAELRGAAVVTEAHIDEAASMRDVVACQSDQEAEAAPALFPDPLRWPRRVVMAAVLIVAAIGVIVHLSVATGGPAVAEVARGGGGVSPVASEPTRPAALSPKRPLGKRA